jgi:hypothetical protein
LYAWVISRGTEAHLSVIDFGAPKIQVVARGDGWQRAVIDLSIPEGNSSVTIQLMPQCQRSRATTPLPTIFIFTKNDASVCVK